jgi:DNA-binding MarR family transcriptional regulator
MATKPKTKPKAATTRKVAAPKANRQTKHQQVIDALRRPGGATLAELIELTGWQPHTVRAVISSLRKGMSGKRPIEQVDIRSRRESGRTIYEAAD